MIDRALVVAVAVMAALVAPQDRPAGAATAVLVNAHAHNDYEHARPLLDALSHGFCSVEADVYLVNGELLVAHDRDHVLPDRSLEALYLEPLRARTRDDGGRLYPGGPACTLLIDVKSDAESTYAALRGVLARYADILTEFRSDAVEPRAVTAILSGNEARATIAADSPRYAALDGTLADLDSGASPALVPWVSIEWRRMFTWRGDGVMPATEQGVLRAIVAHAHAHGRKVRFWGAPDVPASWTLLLGAGVDLINTDDLLGLERFLRAR